MAVARTRVNLATSGQLATLGNVTLNKGAVQRDDKIWHELTAHSGGHGVRLNIPLERLVDGQPYAGSWLVLNPGSSAVSIALDWADGGSGSATLQPGETRRVYVTYAHPDYTSTFRFLDIAVMTTGATVLFTEPLVELGAAAGDYFDGDTPSDLEPETHYSIVHYWEGVPGSSASVEEYRTPVATVVSSDYQPPPGGWRYIAQRLHGDGTATTLDWDVPLTDPEIDDTLSSINGLSGTIAPEVARLKGPDGLPLFDEYSTAIFAERDGTIHGGGILVNSGFDENGSWELECHGFVGYAKDMPYTGGGQHFVEKDTLDIWRFIWQHLQSQEGGNIGLEHANTKSGVLVGSKLASEDYDPEGGKGGLTLESQAYKLAYYQDHDLMGNLDDLAADTPFDYHERHFWEGEEIRHKIDFGVPTIGRRRDDLRFAVGENIYAKPSVDRPGEEYANEVYALGAGEGAKMIRGHASLPRRHRLRRVRVVSDSSMRRLNRANKTAQAELQWRQTLDTFGSVVVRDTPHAPIGAISVGDEILIEGEIGWLEINTWCRVLSRTIRPNAPGAIELEVARSDRIAT